MTRVSMCAWCAAAAVWAACSPSGAEAAAGDSLAGLMTDNLHSPANIGATPSFSWRMESKRRGAAQKTYRLKVRKVAPDGRIVWDSGVVESGISVGVKYAGEPLESAMRYFWTVETNADDGKRLEPATGMFETGLLSKNDWSGSEWISSADAPVRERIGVQTAARGASCFVKKIANGKEVKEAYWTVAGLGVFEAYVNGRPVSRFCKRSGAGTRDFLKPGFTHGGKTKHSFTYDVTHLVRTGAADANVFAAVSTSGWWSDKIVGFIGKKTAFRAQLVLRFADGSESRAGTDATWLSATTGPVIQAAIFDGEDYDARRKAALDAVFATGVATAEFKPSEINTEFKGDIFPMEGPPVRLRRDLSLAPVAMYVWKGVSGADKDGYGKVEVLREYRDGETVELCEGETLVVDFGQNAAAVSEFTASAASGAALNMRTSEMLNDGNGAKKRGCDGPEGSGYFRNYRRARSMLNYIFTGGKDETFVPEFTFFGYRYLTVTATGKVEIRKLRSIPVTSIGKDLETGFMETGVADVNKLVSNVKWGQYSNYLSVPTDCPQRNERQGWTADTQVFAEAASYNANVYGFLRKWMRDVRDTQHGDGSYTGVAPRYGGQRIHQFGWADAGVIVPYTMWKQFGDARVVEENWESMNRYMNLLEEMKYTSPQATGHQWADWLSYEKLETSSGKAYDKRPDGKKGRPKADAIAYWQYLGCSYWLWDARMMAAMADGIGKKADADAYRAMADRALAFLRGKFLDAEDGMLLPLFRDMQTPALFALKLGILEKPDAIAKTKSALLKNFKDHGDCLRTGFLGTSILMDTLTYDVGAPDMAYTLLLQHKHPSWLYSVDQGATTIWERWNSYTKARGFGPVGMNSFNHYAYGAVLAWMYGTMAGIQEDVSAPGFKHVILAPVPDKRIGRVSARYNSPYGEISSAWEYGEDGKWTWRFSIPANTTARVVVPGSAPKEYVSGDYTVVVAPRR